MARVRPENKELRQPGQPSIAYGVLGEEPPRTLLIHGLGARWQVFNPLMRQLQERFSLLACDLRGHGVSDRASGHYQLGDFRSDMTRLIEDVSDGPINIYGHSLGGWIALQLAADRPDLVQNLIIADTAIYPDSLDPDLAISYLADLPMALRSMAKSLHQLDPEVMAHFRDGRMLEHYDPDQVLSRITCPTVLLQGDHERGALMTDRDVAKARERLSCSEHVRLQGIGHGLHVEDTGSVSELITSTFAQQSSTRR